MSTPADRTPLLPLSRATLASDPRLLATVREIGVRRGFDYTDDAATAALLEERRKAVHRSGAGAPGWIGALLIVAGILWPLFSPMVPALSGKPPALLFGPAAPLLALGAWLWVLVRRRWKRQLLHPLLEGYREVIGCARAHGVPVTHIPDWMVGRTQSGSGKGAAPIPSYPEAEAATGPANGVAGPGGAAGPAVVAVPAKPPAVSQYEATADEGGWHDEAGCLLLVAGAIGVAYGVTQDVPAGYLAGALVPLAIVTWLAGARRGREKQRLREQAVAYVRALAAAQAAGAPMPELSPVLRKLLAEETERATE
ncbi:hypothetical protein ABZ791_14665 [Streptomyces huasconensis]|uniref:Integral membrane protein n=1 Tax=Streptomyces huasconensis TaxID=1854574 RepID=A0ABV3LQJ2_9ACTN